MNFNFPYYKGNADLPTPKSFCQSPKQLVFPKYFCQSSKQPVFPKYFCQSSTQLVFPKYFCQSPKQLVFPKYFCQSPKQPVFPKYFCQSSKQLVSRYFQIFDRIFIFRCTINQLKQKSVKGQFFYHSSCKNSVRTRIFNDTDTPQN